MIRFIHTADIHFGVENYGRIDPVTGIHTRLLDFQRALDFCIDRAIAQEVDFFLFCGDAYKTTHPSPTQQRLLMRAFLRLYQAKIPVVIIVGNHDNPLSFGKATSLDIFGELPVDGFYVVNKPVIIPLQTKHGLVQIVGIPWPSRHTIRLSEKHATSSGQEITTYLSHAVSKIIKELASSLDQNVPAVLASHLTVSSGVFSGSEKRAVYGSDPMLLVSELAILPFDYVALGHLHRYQNLNPDGYPAVVYSGSIERVDFGERKEDKGFCLVTIPEKGKAVHEFIKTPMRPFVQIDVHIDVEQGSQTEQIVRAIERHSLEHAIVKIVYHLPAGISDQVDLSRVTRACSDAFYVASITPVCVPVARQKRSFFKNSMDKEELLRTFFMNKAFSEQKIESLIKKVRELESPHEKNESD